MKRSPLREESSSEESESESESEEDPGLGPKLQVKADGALILVRNLPKEVTSRDLLLELFDQTPGIEQIAVHTDENGLSKGTADVAVSDLETARDVIAQNRSIAYRGHEIYMTLMGTSTITTTKQQVIAPMPKQHRMKKRETKEKETERIKERNEKIRTNVTTYLTARHENDNKSNQAKITAQSQGKKLTNAHSQLCRPKLKTLELGHN